VNLFEDENGEFLVLVNEEGQYSLSPQSKEIPSGWKAVGPKGKRKDCLDWIGKTWTDMRPRSLIERMSQSKIQTTTP
jgi:MbtH protein